VTRAAGLTTLCGFSLRTCDLALDLDLDLQAGSYTRTTVAILQRDLRRAIPSALGATVSFDLDVPCGTPKEMHLLERTLDPSEIATGLRFPRILPQRSLAGSILFYAAEPGVFDDVVEDLSMLVGMSRELIDQSPALPVSPSVVNVEDFSVVNDALGVLMNRGDSLTEARTALQAARQTRTPTCRAPREPCSTGLRPDEDGVQ